VPQTPGLGADPDPDVVARCRADRKEESVHVQ
jgi:hypothetical protein